jgi:hypothetical protein
MELMIAIVLAGPIGYLAPNRRAGLVIYLLVWAIALPIQTIVVHNENPDDINAAYPVVNALILAGGVAVNRLGSAMGERRRRRRFA